VIGDDRIITAMRISLQSRLFFYKSPSKKKKLDVPNNKDSWDHFLSIVVRGMIERLRILRKLESFYFFLRTEKTIFTGLYYLPL
jgi:hypothetical protein